MNVTIKIKMKNQIMNIKVIIKRNMTMKMILILQLLKNYFLLNEKEMEML